MSIDRYTAKRDFERTPEPKASRRKAAAGKALSFVIQKHAARRLHYDLRLEMDGVLKSWAMTRGPSVVVGEKRLSVHVEDHPLAYGGFEGVIPKNNYGAGNVIIWDRGTWVPVLDAKYGYAKGHLEFELDGEKLHGRFHLVRIKGRREGDSGKTDNWLLMKADDEWARAEAEPDILEEKPASVVSGRRVEEVDGKAPPAAKAKPAKKTKTIEEKPAALPKARKARLPEFVPPALASLVAKVPTHGEWLHEIKFDGYRIQARLAKDKVALLTRSGLDWTERFGKDIPQALAALDVEDAIIDGEIVVETANGGTDFSALQADLSEGRSDRFLFYVFDLMHLNGMDLRRTPLIGRKEALEKLLGGTEGVVRYSGHFDEDGDLVFRHACQLSLEGVISKKRNDPYPEGRSKSWLKSKCAMQQEFVVGGYVPSSVAPNLIGSLVLGVYTDEGEFVHVGRVGTGYSQTAARDLFKLLDPMVRRTSPFTAKLPAEARRGAHFVDPKMVVEVEFRSWTDGGNIRHASFRGVREDKDPLEVRAEGLKMDKQKKSSATAAEPQRLVKLTHPDKLYWPKDGVTKAGLADYYAEIWRWIGPHLVQRPLSLLRGPDGIDGTIFFQKHAWKGMHKAIKTVSPGRSEEPFVMIDDLEGLMGLVQGGVLEIHPWGTRGATAAEIDKPDMLTMDIDPDDRIPWAQIVETAFEIKARLEAAGLAAFVKTSGGKGLHVVSPLIQKATWPTLKAFTKGIADAMQKDRPERYVATVSKAKRKGKILVDYLRNGKGATAVAAYSTRARTGAPVSMPVAWEELEDLGAANGFTIANAPKRLDALDNDPWEDFEAARKPLPSKARK